MLDQLQLVAAGDADIEIAVRGQDDPVVAAGHEGLPGQLIGGADAAGSMGRAPGPEGIDGRQQDLFLIAGGRRQNDPVAAGVNDDGHPVAAAELLDQQGHGLFQERQLVRAAHRSRDIDEKDQIGRRQLLLGEILGLQADAHQSVLRLPGTGPDLRVSEKGSFSGCG